MKIEEIKKYAVPVAIIILAIISFFIIKDFLIPLLAAFILAFLIRPIYKSLEKRMPRQLAAIISILLVALVVLVPLVIIVIAVLSQLSSYLSSALLISLIRRVSQSKNQGLYLMRTIRLYSSYRRKKPALSCS